MSGRNGRHTSPSIDADLCRELAKLRPFLMRRALELTRNAPDADDLVQDTIQRALLCHERFHRGTNLRAWTRTILRNLFIDVRRHSSFQVAMEPSFEVPVDERVPCGPYDGLGMQDVLAALAELPWTAQQFFRLAYLEGMSYRAIGRRFHMPAETVGTRLFRIRARLRQILSMRFGPDTAPPEIGVAPAATLGVKQPPGSAPRIRPAA